MKQKMYNFRFTVANASFVAFGITVWLPLIFVSTVARALKQCRMDPDYKAIEHWEEFDEAANRSYNRLEKFWKKVFVI